MEALEANIETVFHPKTVSHILNLRNAFPDQKIRARSEVMGVLGIKRLRAADRVKKMVEHRDI